MLMEKKQDIEERKDVLIIKVPTQIIRLLFYKKAATYSPTCVVPSALKGLTALFGMVRGETFDYNHLKFLVVSTLVFSR